MIRRIRTARRLRAAYSPRWVRVAEHATTIGYAAWLAWTVTR